MVEAEEGREREEGVCTEGSTLLFLLSSSHTHDGRPPARLLSNILVCGG